MRTIYRLLLALVFCLLAGGQIQAQKYFTGVWRTGTKGYYLWAGVNWTDFSNKWADLGKQNMRLTNIKTYLDGGNRYFSGIWEEGNDGYALTPLGLDWQAFAKFWGDNSKAGLRLINIETYRDNGVLRFLGVFRAGNDGYALTPIGLDWTAFSNFWDDNSKAGLRLINIESYTFNGKRCYLGVFRAGSGGYVLSPNGMSWDQFVTFYKTQSPSLKLIDVERYEENGKNIYLGVWREGSGGSVLWGATEDWECFTSKWAENNTQNLRLIDMETYDGSCDDHCLNQVLMADDPTTKWRDSYNYQITATRLHCENPPGSCPNPLPADSSVWYRWPNLQIGNSYYMRNSVIWDANDPIFTLPFHENEGEMSHNGWLYDAGKWHQAIDWSKSGPSSFKVLAAAPGKVIYIGWDSWSGNTMILSHDVGKRKDVYRTIYMHLRNGPANDCSNAWAKTIPTLPTDPDPTKNLKQNYKDYLNATGCPLNVNSRNPQADYWGTASQKIDSAGLIGKNVRAGDFLAWSGSTGPGGCNCSAGGTPVNTHLHVFFAHRDPVDNHWYLFDPYGIYAYGDCYPAGVTEGSSNGCQRYPCCWKGGKPAFAP